VKILQSHRLNITTVTISKQLGMSTKQLAGHIATDTNDGQGTMAGKRVADMTQLQKNVEKARKILSDKLVVAANKGDLTTMNKLAATIANLEKISNGTISSRADAKSKISGAVAALGSTASAVAAIDKLRSSPTFQSAVSSVEDSARMFLFDLSKADTILQENEYGQVLEVSVGFLGDAAFHAMNVLDFFTSDDS